MLGRPLRLATARGLLWFLVFAVMLATLGGAMLAVALTEGFASAAAYGQALWPRWGSNAMGVLLLAPLMLAWSAPVETSLGLDRATRRLEAAALLAATFASVVAVFVFASGISSPLRILLAVPALWAGLRFGLRGATVVHFALAAPIAFFTGAALHGLTVPLQLELHVGPAQILVSLIAVVGLALAVVIQESQAQLEALRHSEELLRVAMQLSPIGAAIVGLDGRWIDVNPALCRILGLRPRGTAPATDFQTITHPDDLAADLGLMEKDAGRARSTATGWRNATSAGRHGGLGAAGRRAAAFGRRRAAALPGQRAGHHGEAGGPAPHPGAERDAGEPGGRAHA